MDDTKDQDTRSMGNTFVREHPWTSRRNLGPIFDAVLNQEMDNTIQKDLERKLDLSYGRFFIAKSLIERATQLMNNGPAMGRYDFMLMEEAIRQLSKDQEHLEDVIWECARTGANQQSGPELINKAKSYVTKRKDLINSILAANLCASKLWVHYEVLSILEVRLYNL